MREDDERFKERIKGIIEDVVDIEESGWGWGGQEYILTRTDVAANKIFDLIMRTKQPK